MDIASSRFGPLFILVLMAISMAVPFGIPEGLHRLTMLFGFELAFLTAMALLLHLLERAFRISDRVWFLSGIAFFLLSAPASFLLSTRLAGTVVDPFVTVAGGGFSDRDSPASFFRSFPEEGGITLKNCGLPGGVFAALVVLLARLFGGEAVDGALARIGGVFASDPGMAVWIGGLLAMLVLALPAGYVFCRFAYRDEDEKEDLR